MNLAKETTREDLVRDFRKMGIEGRHVMCHASYKVLAPVEGGPQTVVDAIVESVGEKGCVLFPTYDFQSWTERGYWDRDNSPSRMGVITETARKDPRFSRTPHPILSYAVWNDPWPEILRSYTATVQSAHGPGSLFSLFVQNNGLLISIGAEKQSGFRPNDVGFTISNHAAVIAGAPWRRMKAFEGVYSWSVDGPADFSEIRRYAASVNADPTRYVTEVTPAHFWAEELGVITRRILGSAWCWVADARRFVHWAVDSHKTNPELWRKILIQPGSDETEIIPPAHSSDIVYRYGHGVDVRTIANAPIEVENEWRRENRERRAKRLGRKAK